MKNESDGRRRYKRSGSPLPAFAPLRSTRKWCKHRPRIGGENSAYPLHAGREREPTRTSPARLPLLRAGAGRQWKSVAGYLRPADRSGRTARKSRWGIACPRYTTVWLPQAVMPSALATRSEASFDGRMEAHTSSSPSGPNA